MNTRRELLAAFFVAPIAAALPDPDVFTLEQLDECVRKAKNLGRWEPLGTGMQAWADALVNEANRKTYIGVWNNTLLIESRD